MPNLVWKVGAFSAKMRRLALDCLIAMYSKQSVTTEMTWTHRKALLTSLKSRLDDFEHANRLRSVQVLCRIFALLSVAVQRQEGDVASDEELSSMCNALLERLDDSKDDVRVQTCSALQGFMRCWKKPQSSDEGMFGTLIETALLHLDDANEALQEGIFSLLRGASDFNRVVFDEKVKSADGANMQKRT